MSCLPFIRKRFRFFGAASLVLGLLPAACLLVWLGLKNRRDILHASDDHLSQIEELKG